MEAMFRVFIWMAWFLFFCLFLIGKAEDSGAVELFAFSGELLVVGYWVGDWIRERMGKGS